VVWQKAGKIKLGNWSMVFSKDKLSRVLLQLLLVSHALKELVLKSQENFLTRSRTVEANINRIVTAEDRRHGRRKKISRKWKRFVTRVKMHRASTH